MHRIRKSSTVGARIRRERDIAAGLAAFAAIVLTLMPGGAVAHIIQGQAGGFGPGFEHPLTGPDHFLAMFAVGVWGAQMGGRAVWALPVTFPLIMAVGGLAPPTARGLVEWVGWSAAAGAA